MTHDPLCPITQAPDNSAACCCIQLDTARLDERRVAAKEFADAYRRGRRDGGEAMRDACIAAVEALWTDDPSWDGTNWNNALSCALDAIREVQP